MSKYLPLAEHLATQTNTDEVTLTFGEIEGILGFNLPDSAYDHRPWWANRYDGSGSQNAGWQPVGWESKNVDTKNEKVTFYRTKPRSVLSNLEFKVRPLSIAEAKLGLAAKLGVSADAIEIVVRG